MRLHLQTKNSKDKFDAKKSKDNLKDLVLSTHCQDINGQSLTMPLLINSYISYSKFLKK